MAAGRRDTKIQFLRATSTTDEYGEASLSWANFGHGEWAQMLSGTGSERRAAAQLNAEATATFVVLRNSQTASITVLDRVVAASRHWDITGVVASSKPGCLEITAVSGALS